MAPLLKIRLALHIRQNFDVMKESVVTRRRVSSLYAFFLRHILQSHTIVCFLTV